MEKVGRFSAAALEIDAPLVADRIAERVRDQVLNVLHRRGVVVGLSGGVDSSVVAALCVRALGSDRVFGVFMPERDSSDDALRLGSLLAGQLGLRTTTENIGPALAALGCYERQVEAIRRVVPEYGEGWRCKLILPSAAESDRMTVFRLEVRSPDGQSRTERMPANAYLQMLAATNYKQRIRKTTEYYHADRLGYAVAGTPNRLEYDQGFFVKQGDGMADLKPIAHLYKTQVYALAKHLGLPEEIRLRPPTTDTFSLPQTQEEFYFPLPYDKMDLCLYAANHGVPAEEVATATGLSSEQVTRVLRDIERKRKATTYLHQRPLLVESVAEV
jgi:NAD+ synthase